VITVTYLVAFALDGTLVDTPGSDRAFRIGDPVQDLLMARAADMRSVAVTYGVHGAPARASADPTWLADTFEDVLAGVEVTSAEQSG
jgi:phosphoglycolate phosphatase